MKALMLLSSADIARVVDVDPDVVAICQVLDTNAIHVQRLSWRIRVGQSVGLLAVYKGAGSVSTEPALLKAQRPVLIFGAALHQCVSLHGDDILTICRLIAEQEGDAPCQTSSH